MPDVTEVRKEVLEEAHKSKFFIHPGSNKMYQDSKKKFLLARHEKRCG